MKIIGIDYSNTSPGICVSNNFETFDFISIINNNYLSNIHTEFVRDAKGSCSDFFVKELNPINERKSEHYHENERSKAVNISAVTNSLISEIKVMTSNDPSVIVCMEGLAYSRQSNSQIDLAMGAGVARNKVLEEILQMNSGKFFVFTPGELKNAIGAKGNASKEEVFECFINDPIIDSVKESDFYKFILKNKDHKYVYRNNKVQKPWEDVIDSYLAVLKIYRDINS
jgi:hypothetical protein